MKARVRAWLGSSRRSVLRTVEPIRRRFLGTLGEAELGTALAAAGVGPGATVMLHVSMNELGRAAPSVDAMRLIALLKTALTPEGTLLVLTSSFIGWQADYIATNPRFDVRRTPSRMGLMTELFRRMPDTIRSLHPTHSVAGWGANAAEILSTHHLGETFAESSPFCRMRDHNGVVIGIGADTRNGFTILHSAEYLHSGARDYAFCVEPRVLPIKDGDMTIDCAVRPLRRALDRRDRKIEAGLRAGGALTFRRHAGLLIASARAEAFIDRACELITNGSFYRSGPLAPR